MLVSTGEESHEQTEVGWHTGAYPQSQVRHSCAVWGEKQAPHQMTEGYYLASASFPFISHGHTAPLQFIVCSSLCGSCADMHSVQCKLTVPCLHGWSCVPMELLGGIWPISLEPGLNRKRRASVLKLVRQKEICKLHKYKRTLCVYSVDYNCHVGWGKKNKTKQNCEGAGELRQKAKVSLICKKKRGWEGNEPNKSCLAGLN